ncbi:intersectin-EH binding protein Ibp1 [Mycolicibacterium moriokaense]|nr:intersectin-EH binding protein Ibp1 [Mycolicibacterium moriokaense]
MALSEFPVRRAIAAAGFALAASSPAVALFAVAPATLSAPLATCPEGQVLDADGGCSAPNAPGMETGGLGSIAGNPDIPTVDGIPCTGANTGECIGLQESDAGQADTVPPKSTVGDGDEAVTPAS